MNLLLHIGAEKTGTTSVQQWLKINHEALKPLGIWSCRSMGPENNVGLPLLALGRTDQTNLYRMMEIETPEAAEAFQRDGREALRAEIETARAAGCTRFVISSEHLQSRLRDADSVAAAAQILRPLFESVDIILVVRPQLDAMISFLSTKAGGGTEIRADNFETVTEAYTGLYDYHACLRHWADAFPDQTVEAVAYNRHRDSVRYLLGRLGIPEGATRMPMRRNPGQDIYTLAIGNLLRSPELDLETKQRINLELRRLPFVDKPRPPAALARKIMAHFEDGNRRLCADFAGVRAEDLTPDWSKYDETGNLGILTAGRPLAGHLRELIGNLLSREDARGRG